MRNLLPQRFPRDRAPITKTLGAYGIPYALRDVGAPNAVIPSRPERLPRPAQSRISFELTRELEQLVQSPAATEGHPRMKREKYEKELQKLQVRLCHLQDWVKEKQLRVVIVFEGRDGAGKGGTIRALTERLSPRVFRVAALPAPSDREKSQVYMQRYLQHFPAKGEVVIFDRSWYNRAGVEYVMGFCTPKQHQRFLELCPEIEKFLIDGGTTLIKLWLEVSNDEQKKRFEARLTDPLRQWKLSPMDLPSRQRWYDYSRARDLMLKHTDTQIAPWYIVRSDDKRAARLNTIAHVLAMIPHKKVPKAHVKLPPRATKHAYDDAAAISRRHFVEERY
jgi:polyphosphate kinase 2